MESELDLELGRIERAYSERLSLLRTVGEAWKEDDPRLGEFMLAAGNAAARLGDWTAAESHFARAIAVQEKHGEYPFLVEPRVGYALALIERGENEEAAAVLARAARLVRAGELSGEVVGNLRFAEARATWHFHPDDARRLIREAQAAFDTSEQRHSWNRRQFERWARQHR